MKAAAQLLFFLFSFSSFVAAGQNAFVDSLEQVADTAQSIETRTGALFELAATFIFKAPDRSRAYSSQCIGIAEREGHLKGLGDCLNAKGLLHYYQAEYDSAEVLFHRLMAIGKTENDTVFLYKSHGNLGLVYRSTGQSEKAVEHFLECLRLNEAIGNKRAVAKILSDVGGVFMVAANWEEAMKYQRQSYAVFKGLGDERGMARTENSIGVVFQEQLQYDSAFFYFEKSLAAKEKHDNPRAWVATKGNLCRLYMDMGNAGQASACFEELIPVEKELGARNDLSTSLTNLSLLYSKTEEYNLGIEKAKEGLAIAREINFLKVQRGASHALAELFEKKGDFKQALFYANMGRTYNDSLVNETQAEKMAEMQTKYETEKKEQQIILQEFEIENKNQKLYFQKITGAAIGAALLALFGFIFWRNKKQQESRRQKAEIRHQENLLKATVEIVEAERKRISKDLHDGIGQQLSGLKMAWQQLSEKIKNSSPEESRKINDLALILNDAAIEVRDISHQMMPASLRQLGLVAAIHDMLEKSLLHTEIKYEFEHANADGRFSENIEIGLYRIAQELINNIIKHSNAKTVSVELFKIKNHLILNIEDDGKGFDPANMEGAGNGLNNISSRAKSVNGNVQFEQRSGSGAAATVKVPLL